MRSVYGDDDSGGVYVHHYALHFLLGRLLEYGNDHARDGDGDDDVYDDDDDEISTCLLFPLPLPLDL